VAEEYGFRKEMVTTSITIDDDRTIPYNVFSGLALPVDRASGKMRIRVQIPKWEAIVIAFLPDAPRAVSVKVPDQVRSGEQVVVNAAVVGSAREVDGLFALRLTVADPNGKRSEEYSRRLLARHGSADCRFVFAANDMPGVWSITVSDEMTGLASQKSITLRHPLRGAAP
jgi:hypothetical protein